MAETVTVRPAADGSVLLYSSRTGHFLQKLPSPTKYLKDRVTVSSSSASSGSGSPSKELSQVAKNRLIRQIQNSGKEIEVVIPELRILPDPSLVARTLTRQSERMNRSPKKTVTFDETEEDGTGTDMDITTISSGSKSTIIVWISDFGSQEGSVSSLATNSWTPSEEKRMQKVKQDRKKKGEPVKQKASRILPDRVHKTAAMKRFRKRKSRVYDF